MTSFWIPARRGRSHSRLERRGALGRTQSLLKGCSGFAWKVSRQIPCAYGLAHLFEREHVTRKRLAIGKLIGAIGSFGVEIVEKAGCPFAISVFADVAGLPGLIDVAALVELNDLIVGLQIGEGCDDVGQYLLCGFAGLLLRLGYAELRARDFSLILVKDWERHVVEKRSGTCTRRVGIVKGAGDV